MDDQTASKENGKREVWQGNRYRVSVDIQTAREVAVVTAFLSGLSVVPYLIGRVVVAMQWASLSEIGFVSHSGYWMIGFVLTAVAAMCAVLLAHVLGAVFSVDRVSDDA